MSTSSRLTRYLLLASSSLTVFPAVAGDLPTGGTVRHGAVDIAAPSAGHMAITQSSDSAIVAWRGFSIGEGGRVDIRQPSSSSAILNRVTGTATSNLDGQLNANGRVYLVNPNGIAIGRTGTVNAGAFVASTLGIDDEAFLSGRREFVGGGRSATVANHGEINIIPGGYAALIGGRVNNTGNINVPLGRIGFGAGERVTLDFGGDGFLTVEVPSEDDGEDALISHSGRLSADGGIVEMKAATARHAARHAINLSGVVEARSVSGRNGLVVLGAGPGGGVAVSGRVEARAPAIQTVEASPVPLARPATGGTIDVTGREVALVGAKLDVSGPDGGGSIRIGGDYKGQGDLARAQTTLVDAATTISADALSSGDGGRVIVWSDDATTYAGRITAKGGPEDGNGGFVEVSGKRHLAFSGEVDLNAPMGETGTLLLDPYNILISDQATENTRIDVYLTASVQPAASLSVLDVEDLESLLASSNVEISTDTPDGTEPGDIELAVPLSWSSGNTLSMGATGAITLNGAINAAPVDLGGGSFDGGGLELGALNGISVQQAITMPFGTIDFGSAGGIDIQAPIEASFDPFGTGSSFNAFSGGGDIDVGAAISAKDILLGTFPGSGLIGNGSLNTGETGSVTALIDGSINMPGSSINAGRSNIDIQADSDIVLGDISNSEGPINLGASGNIEFGNISTALSTLSILTDGFIGDGNIVGGSINAPGNQVALAAANADSSGIDGNISIGDLFSPTGATTLSAGGNISFGNLTATDGSLSIQTGRGDISSVGSVGGFNSTAFLIDAGDDLDGQTSGSISLGSIFLEASTNPQLNAEVDLTYSDLSAGAGTSFVGVAGGNIQTGTTSGSSASFIFAAGGEFDASGPITTGLGSLNVTATDIAMQDQLSGGNEVFLSASQGDIRVAGPVSFRGVTMNAGNGVIDLASVDNGGVGDISLQADTISVDALTADGDSVTLIAEDLIELGTATLARTNALFQSSGPIALNGPIDTGGAPAGIAVRAAGPISIAAPITVSSGGLIFAGPVAPGPGGAINTSSFELESGTWQQLSPTLPGFSAQDFVIDSAADFFLRAVGGDGTDANPFLLADVYGLQGVGSTTFPNTSFALANDIDASVTSGWSSGFQPIGLFSGPYTGTFDGRGFAISGLTSNSFSVGGLFSATSEATIRDLTLTSASVGGAEAAGLVVDATDGTTIERVRVEGSTIASGGIGFLETTGGVVGDLTDSTMRDVSIGSSTISGFYLNIGGVVGRAENSTLERISVESDVVVAGDGESVVGGAVGRLANSTLSNARSAAVVTAEGSASPGINSQAGGLVGINLGGTVSSSSATGSVNVAGDAFSGPSRDVGGLIGTNSGSVTQAFANVDIEFGGVSDTSVGGLIGRNTGSVSQAYAAGPITMDASFVGPLSVGGLVGSGGGIVSASFWDSTTTGQDRSDGGGIGLTTAEFQNTQGFIDLAAPLGWNFTTTWAPPNSYPQLYANSPVVWVIPDNISATYGFSGGAPFSGVVNGGPDTYVFGPPGDTLDVNGIYSSPGFPNGAVGAYPINVPGTLVSAKGVEYSVVSSAATLSIAPAILTIAVPDQDKQFGQSFSLDDVAFGAATLFGSDSISALELASDGTDPLAPVGAYPIAVIDVDGSGLSNYALQYQLGQLFIAPAPVTVTVPDQAKLFGQEFSLNDVQLEIGPLVGPDDVEITLTSAGADPFAPPGSYPITVASIGGRGQSNYDLQFELGELEVLSPLRPGRRLPRAAGGVANLEQVVRVISDAADFATENFDAPFEPLVGQPADLIITTEVDPTALLPGASRDMTSEGGGPISGLPQPVTESTAAAEQTLTAVTGFGNDLDTAVQDCQGSASETGAYLDCLGAELESYAEALDSISLQLPEDLQGVSAVIRQASRRIANARSIPEAVEIINETLAVVNIAILEVTERTAQTSAEAPAIARLQVAQASAVRTALDGVGENLRTMEG